MMPHTERPPVAAAGPCLATLLGTALLLVATTWTQSRAAESDAARPWYLENLSGRSRTVFQYRSADGEDDTDFYQYLYLRGRNLADRRLDFYVSGRLQRDLDDTSTSMADDLFASVEDTSSADENKLYQCYLEGHDKAKQVRLRAGRQYVDIAYDLHIDGAQLMLFENGKLGGRVFGGLPVSYYSSVSDDYAGGISLVGRPWNDNRTRLTYTRYHDDSEDTDDERFDLDVRQRWPEDIRSRARASMLNDDFEMAGLDLYYLPFDADFDCTLGVRWWGSSTGETRAYSPLYRVLGEREPYTYIRGSLSKGILPWLWISPGFAARLVDSDDEDAQNRNYGRYDLALAMEPSREWDASVAAEYWHVDEGDSFLGFSGEVRYRRRKAWEVSAGAGYVQYDYGQVSDYSNTIDGGDVVVTRDGTRIESSPDVYTYTLRGKWHLNEHLSLRARADVEDNSEEDDLIFRGRGSVVIRL